MSVWRLGEQHPPEPRRVTDDVVMRLDGVYEVEPSKMRVFAWEHLDWMHDHFADEVLSTGLESETGVGH
jgi:hypothetical protein